MFTHTQALFCSRTEDHIRPIMNRIFVSRGGGDVQQDVRLDHLLRQFIHQANEMEPSCVMRVTISIKTLFCAVGQCACSSFCRSMRFLPTETATARDCLAQRQLRQSVALMHMLCVLRDLKAQTVHRFRIAARVNYKSIAPRRRRALVCSTVCSISGLFRPPLSASLRHGSRDEQNLTDG